MTFFRQFAYLACLFPSLVLAQTSKPHVVMLVAEGEYQTHESLPAFAEAYLPGHRCTFVFADPDDPNRLSGIEAVDAADVLVISVRRRTLPKQQLDIVRRYVASGKPVIGIRTASHAFCLRNQDPPEGKAAWPEFDRDVLGGNYTNHYGNELQATVQATDSNSGLARRLLRGLKTSESFVAGGSLYRVLPLADQTTVLLTGRVEGQPPEPIAWAYRRADGGKSFYTSLGHVDDFRSAVLPQLLVNAIAWSLEK